MLVLHLRVAFCCAAKCLCFTFESLLFCFVKCLFCTFESLLSLRSACFSLLSLSFFCQILVLRFRIAFVFAMCLFCTFETLFLVFAKCLLCICASFFVVEVPLLHVCVAYAVLSACFVCLRLLFCFPRCVFGIVALLRFCFLMLAFGTTEPPWSFVCA